MAVVQPSMKQARELGYTASAFPDEAASPLPDIEPVFGRPRTPQPYDYTPPPNLLEALRGALPYWGQGDEETETNAKNDIQNASDEEINRVDPETGDTPLLLSAQYGAGETGHFGRDPWHGMLPVVITVPAYRGHFARLSTGGM